jgi:hypothetical protein
MADGFFQQNIAALTFDDPPDNAEVEVVVSPDEYEDYVVLQVKHPNEWMGTMFDLDTAIELRDALNDAIDYLANYEHEE